jgi:polyribonucleotide 5'-hydroxyl-kinase
VSQEAAILSSLTCLRYRAVSAAPSTCYESTSSTFAFLTSLHLALERRRILARRAIRTRKSKAGQTNGHEHEGETYDSEAGPRVMVLGPANAGKSTMIKNLVNLALGSGMGWAPVVVSLDPSNVSYFPLHACGPADRVLQSPHLVPGSLSLSTPTQTAPTHHPSHPLGSPPTTSAATTLASDVPTVGWYIGTSELAASGSQRTCFPLWRRVVGAMQDAWEQRREKDDICKFWMKRSKA